MFWHANGWTLYRVCQEYMRARLEDAGYVEVNTPQLVDRSLWERSGHWEKFRENMFTIDDDDDRVLAVKPMNCPCHVQIYKQGITSYRDLPLRMAEFGSCHRYEPSGALHGIMRVRAFTQDDAHIFCTEDQIVSETKAFCELLQSVYRDFGFTEVQVKFADRPPVRAGDDATWDRAEKALIEATEAAHRSARRPAARAGDSLGGQGRTPAQQSHPRAPCGHHGGSSRKGRRRPVIPGCRHREGWLDRVAKGAPRRPGQGRHRH